MVTGENAQAARIDGQRLGDGEFGAEVGNPRYALDAWRAGQVLLEGAVLFEDALGMLGQPVRLVGGGLQDRDRIMRPAPRLGRERLEKLARGRVPRPAQVVRQLFEKRNEI